MLDLKVLIERYEETKTQIIGEPTGFRNNFLAMVARAFGDEAAIALDATLA